MKRLLADSRINPNPGHRPLIGFFVYNNVSLADCGAVGWMIWLGYLLVLGSEAYFEAKVEGMEYDVPDR